MHQGDTKRLHISVQDPDGQPISLVAVESIKWWVAKKVTSTTRLLEKTIGSGITVTNAAGGQLTVEIDPEDTDDVVGDYYHEMEIIDSAGDIGTVLRGTMTVARALVTNPTTP
jgi:hypothetical protein